MSELKDDVGPEELGSWLGVTGKSVRELAERDMVVRVERGRYAL